MPRKRARRRTRPLLARAYRTSGKLRQRPADRLRARQAGTAARNRYPSHRIRPSLTQVRTVAEAKQHHEPYGPKFTVGIALTCSRLNIAGCWAVLGPRTLRPCDQDAGWLSRENANQAKTLLAAGGRLRLKLARPAVGNVNVDRAKGDASRDEFECLERAADPLDRAGINPELSAILRTPGLPGVARAFLICSSNSGYRGRPSRFPSLLARASPARTRSWIIARSNSAKRPSSETSPCPPASWCRGPADRRGRSEGVQLG